VLFKAETTWSASPSARILPMQNAAVLGEQIESALRDFGGGVATTCVNVTCACPECGEEITTLAALSREQTPTCIRWCGVLCLSCGASFTIEHHCAPTPMEESP
jgi:hypothetical protein